MRRRYPHGEHLFTGRFSIGNGFRRGRLGLCSSFIVSWRAREIQIWRSFRRSFEFGATVEHGSFARVLTLLFLDSKVEMGNLLLKILFKVLGLLMRDAITHGTARCAMRKCVPCALRLRMRSVRVRIGEVDSPIRHY